ncbi:AMP-binding protein [Winogradskyella poriferorum]|uniref:AMP-binding protein n=1 Tax=Winogradskyella poriferorum TaxID=307627 RepID=UPI003D649923
MFSKRIIEKFLFIANHFPNNNAFCIDDHFYTYSNFLELIGKQRSLINDISFDDNKVGLVVNDDIFTYASIFALWMSDMAYVPLHPKFPIERNYEIIEQASIKNVLDSSTDSEFDSNMVINSSNLDSFEVNLNHIINNDNSLAYILFTSGSTGKPKGVQITFKNLDNFVDAFMSTGFKINKNDKCLQCFDLTFDVSVQSFLVPLIHGACIYTVPHNQIKYSYVYGLLDDHELTFGIFAPSMIRMLEPYFDEINLKKLRYCILTAEASPVGLVEKWSHCIPNAKIFNFYGPTEATIYCTSYEYSRTNKNKESNGVLGIGKPFKGIEAIILNEEFQPVPIGEKGEMYVAGNQITMGYWNNPELNKKVFKEILIDGKKARYYKTGDLCMFDKDNDLLYYGRIDNQVKIQGFRIELGEIEHHSRNSINGKNAIAFTFLGETGANEIAICLEDKNPNKEEILNYLKNKLPHYMVPTKIYHLDSFPLNTSDKVDKKKIIKLVHKG